MRNTVHCSSQALFDPVKVNKAMWRLQAICQDSNEPIIQELLDYESLPFIDLLIKTGIDQDELRNRLSDLMDAGVLVTKRPYYQAEYQLNTGKFKRILQLAALLAL